MVREAQSARVWASRRGVRASAGSGKTYDLTGHYLRWLLLGADPAGMLATTFTKKAAGEILARVMNRLSEACASEANLASLAEDLALPGLSLSQARERLLCLCRSMHQVSISTIDSFFGRLLRSFRHELGLPADMRIVEGSSTEIEKVREQAVQAVLSARDRETLLDLLVDLHRGKASQRVASDLAKQLSEAHAIFQMSPTSAWDTVPIPNELLEAHQRTSALRALEDAFLLLKDRRQKAQAEKELGLIQAEQWETLLGGGIAGKVLAGQSSYYAPLPEEVIAAYRPIVGHARTIVLRCHVSHTKALYRLLALYDKAYRAISARERVMVFGDVPLLLSRLFLEVPAGEIARRMDCRIDHLLLDEFQDTDPEQYAILKPFADTIHALPREKGLIYCVGDLKQSIYGWRGATPQIFERFGVDLPDVAWSDNDASYRSAQAVLESVNRLFGALSENPVLCQKCPDVAESWQARFHPHTAKKDLAGFVQLLQSPGTGEDGDAGEGETEATATLDPHMDFAARKIREIAESAPWATVGVLTRTGRAARQVIHLLGRMGVAASAEGGSSIGDDPAVSVILSTLTLADHPSDTAALFHAINSPLAEPLALRGEGARPAQEVSLAIRRQLAQKGYASTLSRWASILIPHCDAKGAHRLEQLVELADDYDKRPGVRPIDFVRFARSQSVEEPSPSRIRVMTIHKAKGLEFDAVVLPELQMELGRTPAMIFSRDPETLRIDAVSSYPNRVVRSAEPGLARMFESFQAQEYREALCLLYVAMTRARHSLTIIVPAIATNAEGKAGKARFSLASIARAGLAGEEALSDSTLPETLYEHGDSGWHRKEPPAAKPAPIAARAEPSAGFPPLDLSQLPARILRQVTPSSLVNEPPDFAGEAARRRGAALHAMLAHVEWAGDPAPSEAVLSRAVRNAVRGTSDSEAETWVKDFHAMLGLSAVQAALRRPDLVAGERAELWRERDFLQLIDGALVSGKFDRVVLVYAGDSLSRAHIADFKTMDCTPADLTSLVEKYRPQIEMYRTALSAMTGLSLDRIQAEIIFTAAGESVAV